MARLQRKKSPGSKKKKHGGAEGKAAESAAASDSTASVTPVAKKKAYSVSRRPSAAVKTKSEPGGKVQGWWGQSMQFLREVKVELKKVAWPSRKQTVGSTVVVLVLVFIISAFLGVVDMGLSSLVRLVLH
ncbi:MAG: preprotein translocase subunit SecE [Desulfobacterales bacterium]|nr:preprotein translocase subunit SecE [Desulfobacterales bacterium]MDJ0855563.1 preprotein translocase subunit SecE [Desulfobacterales bacterium]MDJ0875417.1 preprotein translocase subunit SecE [Desulfobacterales bacterium]MDJ0888648.1 preprotein translocase subunit SecE [Desulfobacterales bacterium]MDJ0989967.1 preprotein translocase subunit SecE [Desulfobacterales bacterium]